MRSIFAQPCAFSALAAALQSRFSAEIARFMRIFASNNNIILTPIIAQRSIYLSPIS